ncbi:ZrgA family zinc uptake protein [Candidatus Uabimicrobium amorphum]|uniref:Lipoprotein n=1 Tax=Uabimicrobium amorphum TaxID=2596890 RepID=A0A5S9IKJ9_UABAM|nr:DUF2796 domain-containing protein [Candidatus Uabimicrobium amorphum]BBM83146.1 hypothetical protein UABAM_01497 [Candidatus Uabimicrobium amorphum]
MKIVIVALCCVLSFCGCNEGKTPDSNTGDNHHHHSHNPQYGGLLIEVGDHFAHAEMALKDGKLTLYILDGEAENNVRLEQESVRVNVKVKEENLELDLKGVANELTGETAKNTSQFSATHEKLKGVEEFTAVVASCTIKGQKFENITFKFEHKDDHDHDHDHDDHDHDHDHDDDHDH